MTSQVNSDLYLTPIRRKVIEDDYLSPQTKSKWSNPSTLQQSCQSAQKYWSQDAQNDIFQICQNFQQQCCCSKGENCEMLHQAQSSQRLCNNMNWTFLQNYPEIFLDNLIRKNPSFLK